MSWPGTVRRSLSKLGFTVLTDLPLIDLARMYIQHDRLIVSRFVSELPHSAVAETAIRPAAGLDSPREYHASLIVFKRLGVEDTIARDKSHVRCFGFVY